MQQYSSRRGKFAPGIYIITCIPNKKVYIGSSSYSVYKRIRDHQIFLESNSHPNQYLQRAFNKYGKENFIFERLEACDQNKVIEREQYYMDLLESHNRDKGFNLKSIAGSSFGYKYTEAQKKNISEGIQKVGGNKGKFNPRYGAKISEEQKQKSLDSQ